jgi:hypothetical protein
MLWRMELPVEGNIGFAHAAVLVDAGQIIVAGMNAMFAMSMADGAPHWQRRTHGHPDLRAGLAVPGKDVQVDSK